MYRSDLHQVEIRRVLKNSPYNVAEYLPEVICGNRDDVFNLPEVQKVINETYGKKLVVNVYTESEKDFLQYEVEKARAITL